MSHSKTSVFVLGDSISIGYGPPLAQFLGPEFAYSRKRDDEPGIPDALNGANGEDSRKVLGYLAARLARGTFAPDLLILNCGLHDLRRDLARGAYQVPLDAYAQNLRDVVALLADHEQRAVWVSITPVDDAIHNAREGGFRRYNADVERYNARAVSIMRAAGISVIDLYRFVQTIQVVGQDVYADHVHFPPEIARLQGAYVAGFVKREMVG